MAEFSGKLQFGGGINSRPTEDEIDLHECTLGENFDLDLKNRDFKPRKPFDLMCTAPNGEEIRGFATLKKADGTVTLLVQAGGTVYEWDGTCETTPCSFALLGAEITPNTASASSNAGHSVALNADDGTVLILGIPDLYGHGEQVEWGRVEVWVESGGTWTLRESIDYPDSADVGDPWYDHYAHFGATVAINGDGSIIAVGSASRNWIDWGSESVWVYEWNGSSYALKGTRIDPPGGFANNFFSASVALASDGLTVAMGEYAWDGASFSQGAAYVFEWDAGSGDWVVKGSRIDTPNPEASGFFGFSVDLDDSGDYLVVGAYGEDAVVNGGAVYVFAYSGGAWSLRGSAIASPGGVSQAFGQTVSINSDASVVAIGAPWYDDTQTNQGRAYVYEWGGSDYTLRGSAIEIPSTGGTSDARFGFGIDIDSDGSTVAVSAYGWSGTLSDAGAVWVFDWDSSNSVYTQRSTIIEASSPVVNDEFGYEISLIDDGTRLAAGVPKREDGGTTDAGSAFVYECS